MSFWAKLKQFFGFTGVEVKLECPPSISKAQRLVTGQLTVKASATQKVLGVSVKLEEHWKTGRGEDASEKTFTLGEVEFESGFQLAAGETKVIPFSFPFDLIKSNADQLQESGGMLGALGTASKWASGEKSTFRVVGEVDVEGTPFDPTDKKDVQLVA